MPVTSQGRHFNAREAARRADLPGAARTTSGQSSAFPAEDATALEGAINITAVAGTTPTLDVRLETRVGNGSWTTVAAFPQKNAVGQDTRIFGPIGDECRWAWTIAGSGASFTFSLSNKAARS